MKKWLWLALVPLMGCSTLIPKKVELFQDKVQTFPEPSFSDLEPQREAAFLAHEKAVQVVDAALVEQTSTNVIAPARQAEKLTGAVSVSVGPPKKAPTAEPEVLASRVLSEVASQNKRVEDFRRANDENAGKKIEGTGLIQVGYIWWVGGILGAVLLIFIVGKIALTVFAAVNPGAAIGLNVMNAAQSVITKGFSQIVQGGEQFKTWVDKEISDPALKQRILDAFRTHQERAQDKEVQNVIQSITR